jgi:hypothetical protein
MRSILFALLTGLALQGAAADTQPEKENWFKRAGKAIASDAKAGWQKAKQGYSKGGKQIGRGTADAARDVGRSAKESAKRTSEAAKKEF